MSEHTHEHSHTYTHEHPHQHGHKEVPLSQGSPEHAHTSLEGASASVHSHHDEPIPESKDRMVALLDYNCQHNESHASELKRLAEKLKDQGYEAEAAKVSEACDAFEKGNAALREALDLLKKA